MEKDMGQILNNLTLTYEEELKLLDEHQQLYLDLISPNQERKSILFFCPEVKINPNSRMGDYFETIINLDKYQINENIKNNVLYLPGIKISQNKIYTEYELGKTISSDILSSKISISYHDKGKPRWYIFNHFNIETYSDNIETNSDNIIPEDIINSIKKIEKLEIEILKEKNKILNSNFVKYKLEKEPKDIKKYINLAKIVKNRKIEELLDYE